MLGDLLADCDHFVAGAAIIGGITLFHELAYDLIAENERITAAAFDAAIRRTGRKAQEDHRRLVVDGLRERRRLPDPRGRAAAMPAAAIDLRVPEAGNRVFRPGSTRAVWLPYTIVRPFNCIGVGEKRALSDKDVMSGNVKLAMSHVVPDLVQKVLKGQDPLHILGDGRQVRHYTYGGDLARGHPARHRVACGDERGLQPLDPRFHDRPGAGRGDLDQDPRRRTAPVVSDTPYTYDVQKRIPSTEKARRVLGFEATTSLSDALDEIIPWIRQQIELGGI